MDWKQIMIWIIVGCFALAIVFGGLAGVYVYKPEWLGIAPPPDTTKADSVKVWQDTLYFEPVFRVSEKRIREFERERRYKNIYKKQRDSLEKIAARLLDSLSKLDERIGEKSSQIKSVNKNLDTAQQFAGKLQDSISKLNTQMKKANNKIKRFEKRLEDQDDYIARKHDSLETKNFAYFAKIYDKANPAEVARILEQIDERDAARILKMMNKKQAGKIIDAMAPEQAAAILLLGSQE